MRNVKRNSKIPYLFLMFLFCWSSGYAQNGIRVEGFVVDQNSDPVIGATVTLQGSTSIGTSTGLKGEFRLTVPSKESILVFSFMGMTTQEIAVEDLPLQVILQNDNVIIDEIIVVGYGQQRKETVVGAVTQTSGRVLERAGGVSSPGAALTGNLPGVTTVATRGTPGDEDPIIYIRGQSTWNENSSPLILVDGIERPMNSVDISSIESISVLKDASATAVFGVKGANGVILITTKRGREGRAEVSINVNTTMKIPSKLAGKYDSYDALDLRNKAIVREVGLTPSSWDKYTPQEILNKYRNPANLEEAERYPNVDWADVLVKNFTMSHNINANVFGGTKFVKYFTSVDYLNEGDILKKIDNGKTYDPAYGFKRINMRSNLDFDLTSTTQLSVNLSGSYGAKQDVYGQDAWEYRIWQSIYSNPPDAYMPIYSDGSWGYYPADEVSTVNSAATMANNGVRKITTTRVNTDFTLKQKLDFVLEGLSAKATLSFDNTFKTERGLYDNGNTRLKWIDPDTGEVRYKDMNGVNQFDWYQMQWGVNPETVYTNQWGGNDNFRKVFYQVQVDYARKFNNVHDVTAMAAFNREQSATGSEFEHFREDWVFRATYAYANKYLAEFNGAYNGSEKFGPEYRFGFFPSGALGWVISEENFMRNAKFLDLFKLRASYGQIGDDNIWDRWLYMDQWEYGGQTLLGSNSGDKSPYVWWKQAKLGNPNIHWEKVTKQNFGVDFSILKGLVSGSVDLFKDKRKDILLKGDQRSTPSYFGATPDVINKGKVNVKGYEIELNFKKSLKNDFQVWGNFNMTHSKDKVIEADDQALKDWYQKKAGKQIGQTYSHINAGYYNTWDEVYGSTPLETYDDEKLPGNKHIIDYNGDGVIDEFDRVPFGYPERPQNTYNATIGFNWKGLGCFVQFYGVTNTNRVVDLRSFSGHLNRVYEQGSYWTKYNTNADVAMPRWNTHNDYPANTYIYDGSYIRLKNVEVSYTFEQPWVKKCGLKSLRIFVNGNNLWMWTRMPDDREVNMDAASAYPTVRRVNFGINVTL